MGGMFVACPSCRGEELFFRATLQRPFVIPNIRAARGPNRVRFPWRSWDPDFVGLAVLAEFSQQDWPAGIAVNPPPENDSAQTQAEIDELLRLAETERPNKLDDIRSQNGDFPEYFLRTLAMTPASHPATFNLMKAAARVAEMLMAHHKRQFARARPQQLAPALLPPLSGNLHPAYPSGHAMMSRLMSTCLADAVPQEYHPVLREIADDIARNREIAGLHYPSDSVAGQSIADQAHPIMRATGLYGALVEAARAEWNFDPLPR